MNHLSEDELVERYYGEDDPDRARHLETCGECAAAYAALQTDLAEFEIIEPPSRDAGYGEQVWRSLSPTLPVYPRRSPVRLHLGLWLSLGSAVACSLAVGAFYVGRAWEHRQPHPTVANTPVPPPPRVVVVLLSDHLDRSERLLVQLKHLDAEDTAMIPALREEARSLLSASRTCCQDAAGAGDPAVADALDHLNRLLTELANQPDGLNAAAIARLQHEMESDGLLFEVRVLRSRLPDRQMEHSRLKGGTA